MTSEEINEIYSGFRHSVENMKHDSQIKVEESELMKEQFANDMLLLQIFINEKIVEENKLRCDEQFEINLNSQQEFPDFAPQFKKKVQNDDQYYDDTNEMQNIKKYRKKKGKKQGKLISLDTDDKLDY